MKMFSYEGGGDGFLRVSEKMIEVAN